MSRFEIDLPSGIIPEKIGNISRLYPLKFRMDRWMSCFAHHRFAFSRRMASELCILFPSKREGAGKAGCLANTHGPRAEPQVWPAHPGLPCANGFNGCFVLSPVRPGFVATVASPIRAHHGPVGLRARHAKLDTSIGASGPHDFTVRFGVARLRARGSLTASRPAITQCAQRFRVHRIPHPTSVTTRTPLLKSAGRSE
jgi:hypothetical protein